MPRRTRGLGSASKVPLRGFTQLLQNLDPAVKNRLIDAFADAEQLSDFHLRGTADRQTRRKVSGRIATLELFGEANLLGAFLTWDRLDDPRIQMYEVQLSDNNVFSTPETLTTFEDFMVFENLRTAKFARARGVNSQGDVGLWSNTVTLRPRTSAPETLSIEFYQGYSGSAPNLSHILRYSGGLDTAVPHPEFYSVLSKTFYADLLIGGVSVWGYVSSRLRDYRDDGRTIWDRVRFQVNGITRMDGYFSHWGIVPDETDFHTNQVDSSGLPMSFYARGGYTAAFGPYAITLPNTLDGQGPKDPYSVVPMEIAGANFYWSTPNNALRASRFDEAQLTSYDVDTPAHEAFSLNIDENQNTEWLVFRDFRFNFAATDVITGIEAKIKRRQTGGFQDPIAKDSGFGGERMPLQDINTSLEEITVRNIQSDADFGKFVNFPLTTSTASFPNHTRGFLGSDTPLGSGQYFGFTQDDFTLVGWINNVYPDVTAPTALRRYGIASFNLSEPRDTGAPNTRLNVTRSNQANPPQMFIDGIIDGRSFSMGSPDFFNTTNEWIHIALTYDSALRLMTLYKDGVPFDSTTLAAPNQTAGLNKVNRYTFELGDTQLVSVGEVGGYSQWAVFDKALPNDEIIELVDRRGYMDLRQNSGRYESAAELLHYWLYIPDQGDIRDFQVYLVDQSGVRTDLENKAVTDESWPLLSRFFYTDLRQYSFLPLAVAGGVPHDNHTAIGYQTYGGEFDTWGADLTGADVNEFYFGFAIRAKNEPLNGFPGRAFIDHGKLTVYTTPLIDRNIQMDISVAASNEYYLTREVFGAVMNAIVLGEKEVTVPNTDPLC